MLGGSATSFGLPEETGISAATLDALRKAADPHVVFADFEHHGYCVLDVTHKQATGRFRSADTGHPSAKPTTLASFTVQSGSPQLHQL